MDPVTALSLKAAEASTDELVKTTNNLLVRVLGPGADEVGANLARRTRRKLENLERVAEAAARKGAEEKAGEVNARVASKVIGEGAEVDGELAAEYFGGMLAASKTLDGRDDAAVAWVSTVASMSTLQIRLHFLIYREWARKYLGRTDANLGLDDGRVKARMIVELGELIVALGEDVWAVDHSVNGLYRFGLISQYGWGSASAPLLGGSPYAVSAGFMPTAAGLELYCWAMGVRLTMVNAFSTVAVAFDTEPPTPYLASVIFPDLDGPAPG